jgi:peroxiredoxin
MQQIVDLQNDPDFQDLDVEYLSIAFDSISELAEMQRKFGTRIPLLSDATHEVSEAYDVLQWAVVTGEPGHTFVLVDRNGNVAWVRDYGAPENGGLMYVPTDELVSQVRDHLR